MHREAFGGRISTAVGKGSALKTVQYLDAVKRALGITSDYALAQRLELTRSAISLMQNGARVMSNTTAARIAVILELDPLRVIADAELERGSDSQLWKRIREAAAVLVMALGAALLPEPAHALAGFNNNFSAVSPVGPEREAASKGRTVCTLHGFGRALLALLRRLIGGRP